MIEIFLEKKTKSKVLRCLFKKGDECTFTSLRSALAHPREVSTVHTPLLNCWRQLTPCGIHPIPTEQLPTLYLSIGSSCCSWLSRMVWYSLSYFFSFFVGTCGTDLGNVRLKIRGMLEKLTESSLYKQETEEVLESCCWIKSLPTVPPPLLIKPCQTLTNTAHIDRNLSVPTAANY